MRVIASNGVETFKSKKFKSSRAAFEWATPFFLDGYKVIIVEKKRRKFK